MCYLLNPGEVCSINEFILKQPNTLLDRGKLESALARPLSGFGQVATFPRVFDKAAALVDGLCQAHAFIDGNKRTALLCLEAYLSCTNIRLHQLSAEVYGQLFIDVATHTVTVEEVAEWIKDNSYLYSGD